MAAVLKPLGPQPPYLLLRIHLPPLSESPIFPPKLRRSHSPRLPPGPPHPPPLADTLHLHFLRLGVPNFLARRAIDRLRLRHRSENNRRVSRRDDVGRYLMDRSLV
ncbi:pra1 family protein d [Phtheirospermum japonicum]|uniref:Pra1 family protein d n=1 Tax=Phtheirospermum japonicum TaxID=374723 RepID=A0A830CWS8_9LAMI|nr:pra1 family protein d [Phtheirospermum japonicum]